MTQLPEPASGCWNPHFGCFNSVLSLSQSLW
uniref:Uncharacterized protein n=1 Tax=Rhizophora mucronata TaxID=61149 RepID=A0A2P2JPY1_RHIMU